MFGLHYDFHANADDAGIGARTSPAYFEKILRRLGADFVQTDCKGHPGMTSWFSETPGATVSPGVVKDLLAQWRAATRKLRLPLHCHYSGLWDAAFARKHPEWRVRPYGGAAYDPADRKAAETLCPRSPYADTLVIPQFDELITRYKVDGFWVDGDIWAAAPCYCATCLEAWREETGLASAPTEVADPQWQRWMRFTRRGFEDYVRRYCDAVHARKPGVRVCSNWLQTFRNPGEPAVPTDWISGDNAWIWGLDDSRCEARFLANRGKPWDIMLWNFYKVHGMDDPTSPWVVKPAEMLQQEAAVIIASGGDVQVYENPGLRDGTLIPWRMERLRETVRFVKKRRAVCRDSETIPQVAVLHSETHLYNNHNGVNLMWNVDTAPVQGAVFALLENHYSVDILDEWALLRTPHFYPVIVVPEQHDISDGMKTWLDSYVRKGGKLLMTGNGNADVSAIPAPRIRRLGRGRICEIPVAVCRHFHRNRYGETRRFIGAAMKKLAGTLPISVKAPTCVDVTLRRKRDDVYIHLINRSSGLPNVPNAGEIDEIPEVGPVIITIKNPSPKTTVRRCFEKGEIKCETRNSTLVITLDKIRIHEAVRVAGNARGACI
ncbi:MAG: alpha-L-fucosidase, partial [Kiritimatiellaeota bacterium]|nr:alpha-L-fucosidase [Kiritimatiellota bacterium]